MPRDPKIHAEPPTEVSLNHLEPHIRQRLLGGFGGGDLIDGLARVGALKVLLIGDAIIDEYHYVTPLGKSPKEHIITTRLESEERFAGGVIAVANYAASLCHHVNVVTCFGDADGSSEFLENNLRANVSVRNFPRQNASTILKRRYVDAGTKRKLFEVCMIDDEPIAYDLQSDIRDYLLSAFSQYDLVMVSDFGHGLLQPSIIHLLCDRAPFLCLNVQTNSANIGFNSITKYSRSDYLVADDLELRIATQRRHAGVHDLMLRLAGVMRCPQMVVTQGKQGCTAYAENTGFADVPALATRAMDAVGAGDAFYATSAPCVFASMPIEWAALVGSAASALKVRTMGHAVPTDSDQLLQVLRDVIG